MSENKSLYPSLPGEDLRRAAAVATEKLKSFMARDSGAYAHLFADDCGEMDVVAIPSVALVFLTQVLDAMAAGNSVRIVPINSELTTQEGADILNVSRPHLVKLLEQGAVPHTKTGRHRRIKLSDLLAFKAKREAFSSTAMDELAEQAQDLKMGY